MENIVKQQDNQLEQLQPDEQEAEAHKFGEVNLKMFSSLLVKHSCLIMLR